MKVAILILVACNGPEPRFEQMSCVEMSRSVTQRPGVCQISVTDTPLDSKGCPFKQDAYCLPGGHDYECPIFPAGAGWVGACKAGTSDADLIDCTYGDQGNCVVIHGDISYSEIQTLDGVDGLAIVVGADLCEFRPCN